MKHCFARRVRATNPNKLPCYSIWAAMKKGRDVFLKGSRWVVGRDSDLSLWYSNWLENGPLCSLVQGPLSQEASNMKVKDSCLVQAISCELLEDIRLMIRATPLAITSRGRDELVWNGTPQGVFDLKSAYKLSLASEESQPYTASGLPLDEACLITVGNPGGRSEVLGK